MIIKEITHKLEEWAPLSLAESYDNPGLLVGSKNDSVSRILINLDITEEVVDEASKLEADLIIAHHPIWFTPRKTLLGDDYVSRILLKAIRQNIALYAIHTNLDSIYTGVNSLIAEKIGLQNYRILLSKDTEGIIGSGMIGELEQPAHKEEFIQHIKSMFKAEGIRYADASIHTISKVAVCGGSGSFLISTALNEGADAFVTSDITYHKFFDNEGRMLLMDIGHYESEQYTSLLISDFLVHHFPTLSIQLSKVCTNPVRYA